jgi:hypothetical protein
MFKPSETLWREKDFFRIPVEPIWSRYGMFLKFSELSSSQKDIKPANSLRTLYQEYRLLRCDTM